MQTANVILTEICTVTSQIKRPDKQADLPIMRSFYLPYAKKMQNRAH